MMFKKVGEFSVFLPVGFDGGITCVDAVRTMKYFYNDGKCIRLELANMKFETIRPKSRRLADVADGA